MAFSRIKCVLNQMLFEVDAKIDESKVELEAAEQAFKLAESDQANKN